MEDFDGLMEGEREAIVESGRGTAADGTFGPSVGGGQGGGDREVDAAAAGGESVTVTNEIDEDEALAAARFEGCDEDDRVARQLCEAATREEDPFLRAALWEEYNEYRRVLAR